MEEGLVYIGVEMDAVIGFDERQLSVEILLNFQYRIKQLIL